MKKKKKEKLSLKKIIANNIFMLKMIHKSAPGLILSSLLFSAADASLGFISGTYILRYALNGIGEGKSFAHLAFMIMLVMVFRIITMIAEPFYYQHYYFVKILEVQRDIHKLMYEQARRVDLACYENPKYYDAFVKAIEECNGRADTVLNSLNNIVYRVIGFTGGFTILFLIDPILLLFALIPLITIPLTSKATKVRYQKNMEEKEENRRKWYCRRVFYLSDYAKEMRLTDMPSLLLTRFRESGAKVMQIIKKYGITLAALNYIITECNEVFTTLGATMYAAWQTFGTGNIGYGDCLVVINSIEGFAYTLTDFAHLFLQFEEDALYIDNMRIFLDAKPSIVGGDTALPSEGDIVLENVSFCYDGAEKNTLNNVSMRFGKNEKIAIVGHNGAGKSTLVKLLLRLYDAEGHITYGGKDIKEFSLDDYRDMFGCVLQDFHIFAMSAADNVALGKRTAGDHEQIEAALKSGGIYNKFAELPNGIDTMMTKEFDEDGILLSGGEAQKLAISHVFFAKSRFVILDEPSSALDPIAEYEMYDRMVKACESSGMIFISHRLSSAVMADRIYLMENGSVLEAGSHKELMEKNGRYAEMFRKQAANYAEVAE